MTDRERYEVQPMSDEELSLLMEDDGRAVRTGAAIYDFFATGSAPWKRRPEYRKIITELSNNLMGMNLFLFNLSLWLACAGPWDLRECPVPDDDEIEIYCRLLEQTGDGVIDGIQRLRAEMYELLEVIEN